jgi:aminoglycoside phosphotransferase (APT) family kinase protein
VTSVVDSEATELRLEEGGQRFPHPTVESSGVGEEQDRGRWILWSSEVVDSKSHSLDRGDVGDQFLVRTHSRAMVDGSYPVTPQSRKIFRVNDASHDWVASVVGAQEVSEVRSLTFGIVSDLCLVNADGQLLVLRRYLNEALVESHPNLVRDEVIALAAAQDVFGDRVPVVVGSDSQGEIVGHPALLMTYLPGSALIHGTDPDALAQPLATLHGSSVPAELPAFHHWFDEELVGIPKWSSDEKAWQVLVTVMAEREPAWEPAFLHRDFHPGNLLWEQEELVGIVDWTLACRGPRAVEIAHVRSNLALVDDVGAADRFLSAYRARVADYQHHPWWDAAELFTWDSEFAGVMAFNAFGSNLTVELLQHRADLYARSVADSILGAHDAG